MMLKPGCGQFSHSPTPNPMKPRPPHDDYKDYVCFVMTEDGADAARIFAGGELA